MVGTVIVLAAVIPLLAVIVKFWVGVIRWGVKKLNRVETIKVEE